MIERPHLLLNRKDNDGGTSSFNGGEYKQNGICVVIRTVTDMTEGEYSRRMTAKIVL